MSEEYEMEYTREDELLERIAKQKELLNSTIDENKEIYKKMADLDTALEDCTESLTDARIKIKELEEKISILLSCKNCPDNKGGYICQKEYEDKCLAQKIQYIKELQEENADFKEKRDYYKDMADTANKVYNDNLDYSWYLEGQLTEAKKIIGNLYAICKDNHYPNTSVLMEQAEQFLAKLEKYIAEYFNDNENISSLY